MYSSNSKRNELTSTRFCYTFTNLLIIQNDFTCHSRYLSVEKLSKNSLLILTKLHTVLIYFHQSSIPQGS